MGVSGEGGGYLVLQICDLVFGDLLKLFDFAMMGVSTLDDDGVSLKESDKKIVWTDFEISS